MGWYAAAATASRCVNEAGRPRRSFALAAANCAGVRVTLILSATKARTTAACRAGKRPSSREAASAYSALAFAWRTSQSWAPAPAAAEARSSETRMATTASPKRVSVSSRALSAAKAAVCLTEGALTRTGRVGSGMKIERKSESGDSNDGASAMPARGAGTRGSVPCRAAAALEPAVVAVPWAYRVVAVARAGEAVATVPSTVAMKKNAVRLVPSRQPRRPVCGRGKGGRVVVRAMPGIGGCIASSLSGAARSARFWAVDLHVHTSASHCGALRPTHAELKLKCAARAGSPGTRPFH